MTRSLNQLSRAELGRLFPITISDPDPVWPDLYLKEKKHLVDLLGNDIVLRIEHVGSTAVSGLAAKPTIDILIRIPHREEIESCIIKILTGQAYHYMHDHPDHLMFVKGYTQKGFKGQCYHIHMGTENHEKLWNQVYFRDYLRLFPDIAGEYAALKRKLAVIHQYDREAYTEAKTEFVNRVTQEAVALLKHGGKNSEIRF